MLRPSVGHSFARGVARSLILVPLALSAIAPAVEAQWPPKKFTNLKVLPKDIPTHELTDMMGGFTRALGVRCNYCHVGEAGKPLSTYNFADDDKPEKQKGRVMMQIVSDLNEKYLTRLEKRADPAARIRCVTCHHGATVPRTLEELLLDAHATGGLDSTVAMYRSLRAQYYGRATYDFGSVPLADVASAVADEGHPDDGVAINALNVEMNPESEFAKRQHASSAVLLAFQRAGADSGAATYHQLASRYGASAFPEFALNRIGYALLGDGQVEPAIAAFKLYVEAFPNSANAYDSLGDGYAKHGDRELAMASYEKALAIAPSDATKEKLETLRSGGEP